MCLMSKNTYRRYYFPTITVGILHHAQKNEFILYSLWSLFRSIIHAIFMFRNYVQL